VKEPTPTVMEVMKNNLTILEDNDLNPTLSL
jgi:hypothetical protein